MQNKPQTDQRSSDLERMQEKPQTEQKHPDEWQRDLNPDHMAGQNIGQTAADREQGMPTAYDLKSVHRSLQGFQDDDLKQVPVVPQGQRLQQGATYLDLNDSGREEFTATGDMQAGADNCYVPKSEVPYPVWNRLRGIEDPERL
ncbi:MAG: hypothetical protein ACR2H9_02120 [Longimicrobiaceae bacterium]|jgi:hypothetical protein